MTLNRTILLDYEFIQTANLTRTTINNDNVSYLSPSGFSLQESIINPTQQVILTGIVGVVFLRCNGTLQISLNGGGFSNVDSLFINFGSIDNMVIKNNGTKPIDYRLLHS